MISSILLSFKTSVGFNKAINLFQEAAQKNYAYAFNNLGLYYESLNNQEKAYNYFKKSANLNESFACNKIGEYERSKGNKKEALKYYKKALESTTRETSIWAYYNIAKWYYLNGDLETNTLKDTNKAIEYFENSSILIESLTELLYIYFSEYLSNKKETNLNKIYYYKNLIENHKDFNKDIKTQIDNQLKNLKNKEEIDLPI